MHVYRCRHNNAGPKYGIQLFDPSRVRAVEALSPDGELMMSLDLLHIPTPWHNCVVKLANSGGVLLVTKAKVVRAALAKGSVTGGLIGRKEGRAFFALRKEKEMKDAISEDSAKQEVKVPFKTTASLKKDGKLIVNVTVMLEEVDISA